MKKLEVKNLTSPRSGCAVANQFIIFDYTNGIITAVPQVNIYINF